MGAGKVYPRSQISTSFLIFSYMKHKKIRKFNYSSPMAECTKAHEKGNT